MFFNPEGYLELPNAVMQAAEWWWPDRIKDSAISDAEAERLQQHNSAIAQIQSRPASVFAPPTRAEQLLSIGQPASLSLSSVGTATVPAVPELLTFTAIEAILAAAEETEEIKDVKARSNARGQLLAEAWDQLRNPLYTGKLPGYVYIPKDGRTIEPPTHIWGAPWQNSSHISGVVRFPLDGEVIAGRGRLRQAELEAVLDGKPARPVVEQEPPSLEARGKAKVGGAPPRFDWNAIWVEICRIIHEEGVPKTQAELIRRIQDWHEHDAKLGPAPEPTTLKPLISRLWSALKRDGR